MEDHKQLKFHCYDIANETQEFKFRLHSLKEFAEHSPKETKLVIVDHYSLKTADLATFKTEAMKFHDQFISEGYEGAVIRDEEAKYKFDARDKRMQKIKCFIDDEFEILDIVDGLRDEDMCFLMKTKEGNEFKAKPMGTREDKQ